MLDINLVMNSTDLVKEKMKKRNLDVSPIDLIITENNNRKSLIKNVEDSRQKLNQLSQETGKLKKEKMDATDLMNQVANIKESMKNSELQLEITEKNLKDMLSRIPNLVADDVPYGKSGDENVVVKTWGEPTKLNFQPKDHVELGEKLDMMDFERAVKITGSRFYLLKKDLAKMERALINLMLDEHAKHDYQEIIPPFIINGDSLYGTGQLPKFKEDLFKLENLDWYLAPTAEVPLTNIKRDELFSRDELPLKYCAYTPCFRSEAGSYGKDTRGLIRVHQFNKVEMVNIVAADKSEQAHQDMVNRACSILELLKLPYRVMLLCSGDIGFGANKCYDLEVWLPAQNCYREISSVSNCRDFQARRANIRYRNEQGKPEFAHTLNGSGLAVGRTLVAILENYQQEDGSIIIPEALRQYMGGKTVITKK